MAGQDPVLRELRESDVEPALSMVRAAGGDVDASRVRASSSLLMLRDGEPCATAMYVEDERHHRLVVAGGDAAEGPRLDRLIDKALMKLQGRHARRLAIEVLGDAGGGHLKHSTFLGQSEAETAGEVELGGDAPPAAGPSEAPDGETEVDAPGRSEAA